MYDVSCPYCKKLFNIGESKMEAEGFERVHSEHCESNPEAKRCLTCARCFIGVTGYAKCDYGLDVHRYRPCTAHELGEPHKEEMVPVMREDVLWEKLGYVIKAGTIMEFYQGRYYVERVCPDFPYNAYITDLLNYGVSGDLVEWVIKSSEGAL